MLTTLSSPVLVNLDPLELFEQLNENSDGANFPTDYLYNRAIRWLLRLLWGYGIYLALLSPFAFNVVGIRTLKDLFLMDLLAYQCYLQVYGYSFVTTEQLVYLYRDGWSNCFRMNVSDIPLRVDNGSCNKHVTVFLLDCACQLWSPAFVLHPTS